MAKLKSKVEVESKLAPGVVFVLRRTTVERRDALQKALANTRAQRIEILEQYDRAEESKTPESKRQILELQDKLADLREAESRVEIDWALVEIRGLEVDDEPVGKDDLFKKAPMELVQEIHESIINMKGLTAVQTKNSESPSTSSALEGGASLTTIALDAGSSTADSSKGTAPSTSQSE